MGSAGGFLLPDLVSDVGHGSWTSSAALYRFVWAVKRHCLLETVLHAVLGRAALASWIGGMDLRDFRESRSRVANIDDERLLDIVVSVRRG